MTRICGRLRSALGGPCESVRLSSPPRIGWHPAMMLTLVGSRMVEDGPASRSLVVSLVTGFLMTPLVRGSRPYMVRISTKRDRLEFEFRQRAMYCYSRVDEGGPVSDNPLVVLTPAAPPRARIRRDWKRKQEKRISCIGPFG
ncbi:hypothetical protein BOTBODRAFT_343557 [Botryobasidium botryosum FD-172 SS1]|uniref:Uncharacterized protein n=1 Tax=Botryobasidium botryosum (strain FD-172 SS1) TaxID=930990 RepID=A0A067MRI8_BOTB1|nr:hypothetical protein BOTBODRAFT_343557 [Botryobasidium botryosum FD-172 SS1]